MNTRELTNHLTKIEEEFGDLPILGGSLHDDTPPSRVSVLNDRDCQWSPGDTAVGVFIE